jgi:hypothetical protein
MYVDGFWILIGGCAGVIITLSAIAIPIRTLCYRIIS